MGFCKKCEAVLVAAKDGTMICPDCGTKYYTGADSEMSAIEHREKTIVISQNDEVTACTNGYAIVGLIFAIIFPILGLIFGIAGASNSSKMNSGGVLSVLAIILSIICLIVSVVIFFALGMTILDIIKLL